MDNLTDISLPQEIDLYEDLYQCLCSNFSLAYLKGSSFYIGDTLKKWYYKNIIQMKYSNEEEYEYNLLKYEYLKIILDDWMSKNDEFVI